MFCEANSFERRSGRGEIRAGDAVALVKVSGDEHHFVIRGSRGQMRAGLGRGFSRLRVRPIVSDTNFAIGGNAGDLLGEIQRRKVHGKIIAQPLELAAIGQMVVTVAVNAIDPLVEDGVLPFIREVVCQIVTRDFRIDPGFDRLSGDAAPRRQPRARRQPKQHQQQNVIRKKIHRRGAEYAEVGVCH